MADVRPAGPAQARELSVEDLVALTGDPLRTVQARVAGWYQRGYPSVRRAAPPGGGRWQYLVDATSYERFTGALATADQVIRRVVVPRPAGAAAKLLGCTCLAVETADGGVGALIAASCPVHGSIFEADG